MCLLFFCVKYANFYFYFFDVCCLTFYLQQQFVQISKLFAGLMCGVILTVGGKPFKATSSCYCCRDFYSHTPENNVDCS